MAIDQARLQTDQAYRDQVRSQGYFVGSQGGQVYAEPGHPGGTLGPSGGGTAAATPPAAPAPAFAQNAYSGVSPQDQAALQAYFADTAGYSLKKLAQDQAQFEAQLAFSKQQMEAIGIPQIQIQKQLADMQASQFQQQFQLAQQAQQFSQGATAAGLTGTYNGQPTEAAREFNTTTGLNYLTQAAQFAASNPFELSNFERGAAGNPQTAQFIQNLQNNVPSTYGGGTGTGVGPVPVATRLSDIANGLQGGGGSGIAQSANNNLGAIGSIYSRGPNALAPGTLESLNSGEMTTLGQGVNQIGGSQAWPAFLAAYQANPVRGQQAVTGTTYG